MNARTLTGGIIAALWQLTGHWLPTAEPHKRPSVARRIFAYSYGVLGILLGLWVATDRRTVSKAALISAAAGAATVAAYGLDAWLHGRDV